MFQNGPKIQTVLDILNLKSRTLTDILESNQCPKIFQLLSVDVEGHDYEVLLSLDFLKFQPKVIVVELHEFNFQMPDESKIYNLLKKNGYKLIGYIVWNGYFVKTEELEPDSL